MLKTPSHSNQPSFCPVYRITQHPPSPPSPPSSSFAGKRSNIRNGQRSHQDNTRASEDRDKKIEKSSNRQVTFSKRRAGLFRKASELCILSGAEIAIIVKSQGNRTFAFGHPNIEATIDKYLGERPGGSFAAPQNNHSSQVLNQHYHEVEKELEAEKKRSAMMEESKKMNPTFWWQEPVENMGIAEMESYVAALEELKMNVQKRAASLADADNYTGRLSIAPR